MIDLIADYILDNLVVLIAMGIIGAYIFHLKEKIKVFELKEMFSTNEIAGAKKRILNFLDKEGSQFTDKSLYKELNKKKRLDKNLFEVALVDLRKEYEIE
ncbi:MAG: hypothetical protein J7M14_03150 [Planctomycetes bacterium]|nr:hypothetical protein [Planctomycetota bacterium]